jgi:diguanylate cyclase (GGDEF)-like protein
MGSRRPALVRVDPRVLVALGFLLVLAVVATSAVLLVRGTDQTRRLLRHIERSVEVPLGHLDDALEANTAGEASLQRAVVATGTARAELLSQSIAAGETATKAWTSYRASALGLDGEAELAATYERDYAAGTALAGTVLVPIVQSTTPMFLPDDQVVAAERNRHNLGALRELYQGEDLATLRSLGQQQVARRNAVLLGAGVLGVVVLAGFGLALRAARRTVAQRRQQTTAARLADLEARLIRALEFTDSDDDAFRVASRALIDVRPDAGVAIVVADAALAAFTPVGSTTACGVDRVEQCRASRAAVPLQFDDSDALDTCPVLAAGATTPCAVSCVPLSVAGVQAAVLQLIGPVGAPPDLEAAVPLIVRRLGERITAMRALATFQLQASHDPLTDLLNRRSLEAAVARLAGGDAPYAVAFADLDHFKALNDGHGHDAGDRALQAFAATLRSSLRPDDLVGRWGGEEFVVVLPGCDERQAVEAMDRVRVQLAANAPGGVGLRVTVSVGIAVRDPAEPFDRAVARADRALQRAKRDGRDRVEVWRPASDELGEIRLLRARET